MTLALMARKLVWPSAALVLAYGMGESIVRRNGSVPPTDDRTQKLLQELKRCSEFNKLWRETERINGSKIQVIPLEASNKEISFGAACDISFGAGGEILAQKILYNGDEKDEGRSLSSIAFELCNLSHAQEFVKHRRTIKGKIKTEADLEREAVKSESIEHKSVLKHKKLIEQCIRNGPFNSGMRNFFKCADFEENLELQKQSGHFQETMDHLRESACK